MTRKAQIIIKGINKTQADAIMKVLQSGDFNTLVNLELSFAFQNLRVIPVITPPAHPEDINYIVNYRNENQTH